MNQESKHTHTNTPCYVESPEVGTGSPVQVGMVIPRHGVGMCSVDPCINGTRRERDTPHGNGIGAGHIASVTMAYFKIIILRKIAMEVNTSPMFQIILEQDMINVNTLYHITE